MSRETTPLMEQYRDIKTHHQDAILMFRMGDFYEMFFEDAQVASRVLGLTLTSRNNGGAAEVPLAGVPVKAASEYLRRLVQHGFRVAICEQVEDPKLAKGLVRRAVIETITPGAAFADDLLDLERNNFLCAVHVDGEQIGLAAVDVSTGTFVLVNGDAANFESLLTRFSPREILVRRDGASAGGTALVFGPALVTEREPWEFDAALARDELSRQFAVHSVEGLGLGPATGAALVAAGALIRYLRELQPGGIPHLMAPVVELPGSAMPLDEMTRRNLELVEPLRREEEPDPRGNAHAPAGTLLAVLDRTATPMGARLLRRWVLAPLLDRQAVEARLDAVTAFVERAASRDGVRDALDAVRDIERLASKAAAGRATPRELGALGSSLERLPVVGAQLAELGAAGVLAEIGDGWDACSDIAADIRASLVDRPPAVLGDEEVIRPGVDATLDELRSLRDGGRDAIAAIQTAERTRTGIGSLRVGFNRVFGYYLEVSNANRHLVPADYQRRQTLTGAERYVTPALKEYEEKILHATERIALRERSLFEELRSRVGAAVARLQDAAGRVATLDVLTTFALVAELEGYTRPELEDGFDLQIVGGRHPVVERMMPRERFIPNDVQLTDDARMIILTGPNMAGKSTILRQVGLIVLMAQTGCYVPARRVRMGVVDRIFTRVGASDNLVRGQSTFMVEMAETSAILHQATARSLVLLDEIGRGTSTYDGVSIAWAVSEHLHDRIGCKTIFATHYHELTQLADELVAVRNYNVSVRDTGDTVLFLHRLQPGGADRSYGIEVGRLAGLPQPVLARARAVLRLLEDDQLAAALDGKSGEPRRVTRGAPATANEQLGLFTGADRELLDQLHGIDPERITPLEALKILDALVQKARRH